MAVRCVNETTGFPIILSVGRHTTMARVGKSWERPKPTSSLAEMNQAATCVLVRAPELVAEVLLDAIVSDRVQQTRDGDEMLLPKRCQFIQ